MLFGYEVMSDPLWPHGLQPIRFLCPWDSPGKNTGVGCLSFSRASFWIRHWTHVYSNKNYYKKKKKFKQRFPCPVMKQWSRKRIRIRKMVSVWENGKFEATAPFLVPTGSQTQTVANTLEKIRISGMAFLFMFSILPVLQVIFLVLLSLFSVLLLLYYSLYFFLHYFLIHQLPCPCLHLLIPLSGFYKT